MTSRNRPHRAHPLAAALLACAGVAFTARFLMAAATTAPTPTAATLEPDFDKVIKPFFAKNCMVCHNTETSTAGVRVDQLDAKLEDRHLPVWEAIQRRVKNGSMPPKGLPQPTEEVRKQVVAWIGNAIEIAKLRPAPKNGLVRRLTVAQYRNTLRELLHLDDDLTGGLPPDAVSKDGFVNNKDTLQMSPLLTESYFEIAELALNRSIVDPTKKPSIQDFRLDFGVGVNPNPLPEKLVLGAGSALLENSDFMVSQVVPVKPFPFDPHPMRTKYRFIEGYRGNDTVRGWRDYDSIYHAVFADLRGSGGYPKGNPYNLVPQGLLLRPAIPTDELFGGDGTYGPKANFKISVRELPDDGRFRITVVAARYKDGLLLDAGTKPAEGDKITWNDPRTPATLNIPKAGIYQVDIHGADPQPPAPDASRLSEGLTGAWPADRKAVGRLEGKATLTDSQFGKTIALKGESDGFTVPRKALPTHDSQLVGEGDFTVAAWIKPSKQGPAGLVSLGTSGRQGWYFDIPNNRGGALRFQTAGRDEQATASVQSASGAIKNGQWQHIAAVIKRGRNETKLFVNGYLVARASMGTAQFDDTAADLQIGRIPGAPAFQGDIADVRLYRRPLDESEIQALVAPGKQFVKGATAKRPEFTLTLGGREFAGALQQPAFVAVRLEAGPLKVSQKNTGPRDLENITFTPLQPSHEIARKFLAFEKRAPRLGVHLGLRRDCGSTFSPVGPPQPVPGDKPAKFIFEGAIRNFPSPEVDKDNVNYLAGVREIAVRSEFTDGRDMPRLMIESVEFEGPFYDQWPPASHKAIFGDYGKNPQKIIRDFASRAYRRPITPPEEANLMAVYGKAVAEGRGFTDSIKDTLLVVLTSPQFLFLLETSESPAPEQLGAYELASKLSYFLWNGPPDQKTLQLAAAGSLRKQLDSEVARLIQDAKFAQFTKEFTSQWLNLEKFQVLEPDKKRYPNLTRDTRTQLKQEPVEFVQYLIRNNLPLKNLISSDFIVANEVTATYYGLGDLTESGFQFTPILHKRPELGGVLTEAAIMAGLSDGRESNPVKRGAWLARKIIAEPPADPPPNVPALKEETAGLTLRQRLEQHRNQNGCKQCHAKIDPWGVAFEEFDAGGRLKKDPADAKSTLPDNTQIGGANDLKRYLSQDRIDQVAFSFLKHLATYATGRTLTYNELAFLKQDALKLKPGGYRMQDMVHYVASSKMFLEK